MRETHEYLMPDYFVHFACKMGRCRSACCVGWPITISLEDYYRLLSAPCSSPLRGRIDCGLHPLNRPTREEYAQISPRYDGNCPMRMDDGRCGLHSELGEDALPFVCRLYPRGVRAEGDYECSLANSCEGVLELLMEKEDSIAFERREMTFDLPEPRGRTVFFETVGREQEIRLWLISFLQNRALSLPERLMALGGALTRIDRALSAGDADAVDALLREKTRTAARGCWKPERSHLTRGLRIAEGMLAKVDARSQSVRDFGESTLAYFGDDERTFEKYLLARLRMESLFPRWENWFENMLVNHMFFARFPFQDRPVSLADEYIALAGIYTLLRFLCVGWMAERESADALTDVAAAAFRLIDHTEFDRYAAGILKSFGLGSAEGMNDLIRL